MKPLRIAYLHSSLRVGGSELLTLALAERLPRDRFQVEFVSRMGAGPLDERAHAVGCAVHFIGTHSPADIALPLRVNRQIERFDRYVRLVRRQRYDIVDAWLYPADVLAALGRVFTRTSIVVSGRRNLDPHHQLGPFTRPVDAMVNRLTDAVVANSAEAAAFAQREHGVDPLKLRTIRNGVELIEPPSESERRRLRGTLGAVDGEVLIGCVGNYREVKRHELLIDAFAALARDRRDLRLVLVGEGPMRSHIEQQVERLGLVDRIRIHGAESDVRPLYGAFDLVVQASRSEGMPNVLLEAAAAGRPIVATAAGGSTEIVLDGETGLLVPVEDLDALTAAMRRATEDADLRSRLAAAARQHVAEVFGMDRFVRDWIDLYEGLAVSKHLR